LTPLQPLDQLKQLTLAHNPIADRDEYKEKVCMMLPQIHILDGRQLVKRDRKPYHEKRKKPARTPTSPTSEGSAQRSHRDSASPSSSSASSASSSSTYKPSKRVTSPPQAKRRDSADAADTHLPKQEQRRKKHARKHEEKQGDCKRKAERSTDKQKALSPAQNRKRTRTSSDDVFTSAQSSGDQRTPDSEQSDAAQTARDRDGEMADVDAHAFSGKQKRKRKRKQKCEEAEATIGTSSSSGFSVEQLLEQEDELQFADGSLSTWQEEDANVVESSWFEGGTTDLL
jgi:hypothetical protein